MVSSSRRLPPNSSIFGARHFQSRLETCQQTSSSQCPWRIYKAKLTSGPQVRLSPLLDRGVDGELEVVVVVVVVVVMIL